MHGCRFVAGEFHPQFWGHARVCQRADAPTLDFQPRPDAPLQPLEELFRAKAIHLLVEQKLLPPERVQILYSWKHSGFNMHAGQSVPPEAKADLEKLAQYILRNPFSVEKMTKEFPAETIIYRSRLNAKINLKFEVFSATDFLAAITQHFPDKGAQMVRYCGWHSNKTRGVRQRGRPGLSPPPPLQLPSKRWRDLILWVWHVDPLRCPVCQHPMRVLALIDERRVVERFCAISVTGMTRQWPGPRRAAPDVTPASLAPTWTSPPP